MASGTIERRVNKSGVVTYAVRYRDANKQQYYKSFNRKKDAQDYLAKVLNDIKTGEFQPQKDISFKELAEKWLELKKDQVRPKVYASYKPHVNRLIEEFGDHTVRHISTEAVEGYAIEIGNGDLTPATANRCLTILKGIFKTGLRWNYLAKDPSAFIARPKIIKKEMDFLTVDEIRRLIEATDERYRILIMTACLTGMRQSELLALRWSDCDFNSNKLYVRQVLQGGKFYPPKTETSQRAVIIPGSLVEALKVHQTRQAVELAQNEHDLVFTTSAGTPIASRNLAQRIFEPALKRAGLHKVGMHSLRHSYVSLLISQGEDLKFIQNQVGHASAKITLDVYGHLYPGKEREAMQRLEANFKVDSKFRLHKITQNTEKHVTT